MHTMTAIEAATAQYRIYYTDDKITISGQAIELYDRWYPLSMIDHFEEVSVPLKQKESLDWIRNILGILFAQWLLRRPANTALRPVWESPDLDLFAPVILWLAVVLGLIGIEALRRRRNKRIYTVRLAGEFGQTTIAASLDQAYVARIIRAIRAAKAGNVADIETGWPTIFKPMPAHVFFYDYRVRVTPDALEVGDKAYSTHSLASAEVVRHSTLTATPILAYSALVLGLFLVLAMPAVFLTSFVNIVALVAFTAVVSTWIVHWRTRDKPDVAIYSLKIKEPTVDEHVLATEDESYADKVREALLMAINYRQKGKYVVDKKVNLTNDWLNIKDKAYSMSEIQSAEVVTTPWPPIMRVVGLSLVFAGAGILVARITMGMWQDDLWGWIGLALAPAGAGLCAVGPRTSLVVGNGTMRREVFRTLNAGLVQSTAYAINTIAAMRNWAAGIR
jgi:hypothetical protein